MTDTTVTTETPAASTTQVLPNNDAARSATGEILEPSQIKAPEPKPTTSEATPAPEKTSTSEGAPETYSDFKAPDGYTIDPQTIEAAAPIFKELGLTQDQAQKLVDFHTSQMIAAAKAPESEYATVRADWVAKAKADPDMAKAVDTKSGKTGLEAVKIDMSRALAALGDVQLALDFKQAMDITGAGDNPAFIKTFWKLSQFITEGSHVNGSGPSVHGQVAPGTSSRPDPAHALYPNLS